MNYEICRKCKLQFGIATEEKWTVEACHGLDHTCQLNTNERSNTKKRSQRKKGKVPRVWEVGKKNLQKWLSISNM